MKYVLILWIIGGNWEPAVATAEFNSKELCEAARDDWIKTTAGAWHSKVWLLAKCYQTAW